MIMVKYWYQQSTCTKFLEWWIACNKFTVTKHLLCFLWALRRITTNVHNCQYYLINLFYIQPSQVNRYTLWNNNVNASVVRDLTMISFARPNLYGLRRLPFYYDDGLYTSWQIWYHVRFEVCKRRKYRSTHAHAKIRVKFCSKHCMHSKCTSIEICDKHVDVWSKYLLHFLKNFWFTGH